MAHIDHLLSITPSARGCKVALSLLFCLGEYEVLRMGRTPTQFACVTQLQVPGRVNAGIDHLFISVRLTPGQEFLARDYPSMGPSPLSAGRETIPIDSRAQPII